MPRKNLRTVGGKPLIAWTVEAACRAETVDRVILSSDDAESRPQWRPRSPFCLRPRRDHWARNRRCHTPAPPSADGTHHQQPSRLGACRFPQSDPDPVPGYDHTQSHSTRVTAWRVVARGALGDGPSVLGVFGTHRGHPPPDRNHSLLPPLLLTQPDDSTHDAPVFAASLFCIVRGGRSQVAIPQGHKPVRGDAGIGYQITSDAFHPSP